jgi:hypothetical protein
MAAVSQMTWRIVVAGPGNVFLTSDNPAFFFDSLGLASDNSELTFPLTSEIALAASWRGPARKTLYGTVRPAITKEINRRAATSATRFVFCSSPLTWVGQVACKPKPYLSRIDWDR